MSAADIFVQCLGSAIEASKDGTLERFAAMEEYFIKRNYDCQLRLRWP